MGGGSRYSRRMSGFMIRCPDCTREYLLPMSLMGAHGARVRCPACAHEFVVGVDGEVAASPSGERPMSAEPPTPASDAAPSAPSNPAPASPAHAHARAALDALEARVGPGLFEAAQQQRLFRDHGPALLEAFDDFRRRAGRDAAPEVFRNEVRQRLGVDLLPTAEARQPPLA